MNKRQKEFFEKTVKMFEDGNCPTLEICYKPAKEKWRYICECGEIREILPHDFKRGRRCRECGAKKVGKANQTPLGEVEQIFLNSGYKVTGVETIKGRNFYSYVCPNNHTGKIVLYSFKSGHRCGKCAIENTKVKLKLKDSEVEKVLNEHGCSLVGEYVNYDTPFKYKCSCGNISIGYISAIKKGIKCGCGYKSGEEHASWNPDLKSEERQRSRGYPEYLEWVSSVYQRDNYTCQCCGERGVRLNAHHIYNYSQYRHLRTDISNGITLCEENCHRNFHKSYGYKNNNLKQLQEYIHDYNFDCFMAT